MTVDAGLFTVMAGFALYGLFHVIIDVWNGIDIVVRDLRRGR